MFDKRKRMKKQEFERVRERERITTKRMKEIGEKRETKERNDFATVLEFYHC